MKESPQFCKKCGLELNKITNNHDWSAIYQRAILRRCAPVGWQCPFCLDVYPPTVLVCHCQKNINDALMNPGSSL